MLSRFILKNIHNATVQFEVKEYGQYTERFRQFTFRYISFLTYVWFFLVFST